MDQSAGNVKNHIEKPFVFKGVDFKRWQQKMMFYLTTLNLAQCLTSEAPELPVEGDIPDEVIKASEAWSQNEFLCKNYILNALDDSLYDVYQIFQTPKELWESLEKKYKSEVASAKKFIVGKFLNFKMSDTISVVKQVEEIQIFAHELRDEDMGLNEAFLVASIIEKLPPTWKDFKIYLKHLHEDMSLEQLILKLRVEEENRKNEKSEFSSMEAKANVIEGNSSKFKGFKKNKNGKKPFIPPKGSNFKNKPQGACWVCGKPGHRAKDCRHKKEGKSVGDTSNANLVEDQFVAVVSEANMMTNSNDWWIDTGATKHVCSDASMFSMYVHGSEGEKLYMGNASTAKIEGKGKVVLKLTSGKELALMNVLHVPEIRKNLISGSLLSNKGFKIVFESDKVVLTKGGMYVGKGYLCDGLFKLNVVPIVNKNAGNSSASVYLLDSNDLWHARLGHVNYHSLNRMMNLGLLPKNNLKNHERSKCEVCVESKYSRHSYKSVEKSNLLLGLIHSDLCDFQSTPSRGGKNYYISFIDDYSKFCQIYLIKTKDEALDMFKKFKAEVENQLDKRIKILRSDRGGEYLSNEFSEFCSTYGIIHQTTAPYTPMQNGVAERKNRTLKEMMNSMLNDSGAPSNLWGEAILTANSILNKIPHKKCDKTPYEMWKDKTPSYKNMKVWGCLAKVQVPLPKRTIIGPKTVDCVYIGPAENSAAYRFIVHKSDNAEVKVNTIIESNEAEFFEDVFPYKEPRNPCTKRVRDDNDRVRIQEEEYEPRRSKRARVAKDFGTDFMTFLSEYEPQTYKAAMESLEASYWKEAIQSEVESILSNHTWELVDLPPGNKLIGHKWIFTKKLRPDGTIEKYKARLVAKGFRQKEGLDFFDTYSPVTRITSIRFLIAVSAIYDLEIHQMDVKTAFLNGELDEEIYMEQPEGFIVEGKEKKVCKLKKSLYGLKQAPKQWHEKFDNTMRSYGFKINECDKCVYIKETKKDTIIVCLYVDDMLIMGTSRDIINTTKKMLSDNFEMKDMGLADVILGIRIKREPNGYSLTQSHYVEKVLKKFGHYDDRPVVTPFDPTCKLSKNEGESVSQLEYTQILGSIMYITNCTRPDLAYSLSRLSRYASNPNGEHWNALVRVLRYLKHTMNYGLYYTKYPPVLEGYSDANWISGSTDSKSTSGYVFTLGGGAVSWKSSKQTCIARSTMESEFIALDSAAEEAEWLRNFLEDIPLWPKPVTALCIHCDNMAALNIARNKNFNGKSRHIRRRHATIRQLLSNGVIALDYIRSKENLADPLTKGLTKEQVVFTSRGIGLKPTQ
ncbi:Zinc finger CCHC-type [Arabidopsis thaliana x Arabidopsis arenosa]|uniref:Zinc finger CCHC-type n=1 Tax=Arabidopsis thaliana x Arabidopsis arenosa TaxID=1240361 RepID=A0A8T1Z129_9BRAS|nr:Zinc finger CCHC-type [Arabidopsis thaliana x Arabidopsis arenosa]